MRVCVYGAGAVGGHLAARLAAAGTDVSAIARGPHGQAIRERGLVLLRGDERLCVRPRCVEDPAALPPQDIVIVAVKGPGLPAVAARLPSLLGAHTRVVFAMNGIPWWFGNGGSIVLPPQLVEQLDPGRQLRDALHPDQIVGCVVYSSNVVIEPGVIRNMTPQRNRMLLGRPDGGSDALLEDFAALLAHAGYDCAIAPDIRQLLWHKMLLIVSGSPISTLTGQTFGGIVGTPELRALMATLMREAGELGGALGFAVEDDIDQRLDFYLGSALKPSMLQDLEAGRALEIDNGISAFRAIAAALRFPVPALDVVGTLLAGLAAARAASPPRPG
ncbi:MAG: 2-dehydropantoate 2-reductase [Burkholderiales bacterium]|nr:2-dehydropantoate 2-reductase [Burkholderiales bacterium]